MAINLSYLQEITGGEPAMMREMLDLFIQDIPEQLDNVRNFYDEGNFASVGTEAHKLKPTLQYIGCMDMYEYIKKIEYLGKNELDTHQIQELLDRVFGELDDTIASLKKERAELS